jgi:D-sedoheptulose 7-phosphate isomerase
MRECAAKESSRNKNMIKSSESSVALLGSVSARFEEIGRIFTSVANSTFPAEVEQFASLLVTTFQSGKKLLVFGNGGSASDAQHLCGELVVRFQKNRRALPAIALCCDSAVVTACGNDFAFKDIFARQIQALGAPGDVALGISTSGNSPNVAEALKAARELGLTTALLTGAQFGEARNFCDIVLAAPAPSTARIQEIHLAAYHSICELVEAQFS